MTATVKISALPSGSAIADADLVAGVQSGATVSFTGLQVKTKGQSGLATVATSGSASDLGSGTLPAGRLPNPGASSLGGVQSYSAVSHQFLTQISTSGVVSSAQPAFTDISGAATLAQMPNGPVLQVGAASVNLNASSGTDVATVTLPAGITKWRAGAVFAGNASTTPTNAVVDLWTGAGGTGTHIGSFSNANLLTLTSPTLEVGGTAPSATTLNTATSFFVRVTTTNGGAATCSFLIQLFDWTGF